jgi:hypothetical protein
MRPDILDCNGNVILNLRRLPTVWFYQINYFEYCGQIIKNRYGNFQTKTFHNKEYFKGLPNSLLISKDKYEILKNYDTSLNFLRNMQYIWIYEEDTNEDNK